MRKQYDIGLIKKTQRLLLVFVVTLLWSVSLNAQPGTLWMRTYGGIDDDRGHSVAQTSDGGYIIAGRTSSFGTGSYYDVYLIKTDENGNTLWTKTYGGTGNEQAQSVVQTDDGGYIIAGDTNPFGAGGFDVCLIKTDANGDTLWTRTYGGPYSDVGNSVAQNDNEGYIIAGSTKPYNTGSSDHDVYLIKTDASGDTLWTRTYGGPYADFGYSVAQTSEGGYIIGGRTSSFGTGSYSNFYLIKTDVNGDTLWTTTYSGPRDDYGTSVAQTRDYEYILAGFTRSYGSHGAGSYDVWLIKTEPEAQDYKLLSEGWNWVSFPVLPNPAGTNALDVLEPILDPDVFDKVVYENRDAIYYVYPEWHNDLPEGNFRSIDGYKIKMHQDADLDIAGFLEDPDAVIDLYAEDDKSTRFQTGRENWIGYFLPNSQIPQMAFSQIWDKLIFIKADMWAMFKKPDGSW